MCKYTVTYLPGYLLIITPSVHKSLCFFLLIQGRVWGQGGEGAHGCPTAGGLPAQPDQVRKIVFLFLCVKICDNGGGGMRLAPPFPHSFPLSNLRWCFYTSVAKLEPLRVRLSLYYDPAESDSRWCVTDSWHHGDFCKCEYITLKSKTCSKFLKLYQPFEAGSARRLCFFNLPMLSLQIYLVCCCCCGRIMCQKLMMSSPKLGLQFDETTNARFKAMFCRYWYLPSPGPVLVFACLLQKYGCLSWLRCWTDE